MLRWQVYVAAALTLVAGYWGGLHGAVSALLGSLVNITAGLAYAMLVSGSKGRSAGETLRTLVRAEAGKVAMIVLLFWLVLTMYSNVVLTIFFAAFVISVLMFPLALLVRE